MVLLAAAISTKAGKPLLSRQFVEMSRPRIEGLLAAFPKLVSSGKQHTFVETESVRYVYQPLDKLYMILITTRASNILEDLETLRLFSRVIPECCKSTDESDIIENAFSLIFAFDEIVALGYRESVNLAQIRTFVEMDSHEEKVYQAVRLTQEREAKQKMKEKARELQKMRQEEKRTGISSSSSSSMMSRMGGGSTGGFGGNFSNPVDDLMTSSIPKSSSFPAPSSATRPSTTGKSLKLGNRSKEWDTFADQLKQEGETIAATRPAAPQGGAPVGKSGAAPGIPQLPSVPQEAVHLRAEEKLSATVNRDGGLQSMEVSGLLTLRITDERFGLIKILTRNEDDKGVQITQHPNIDKELFKNSGQIALKVPGRPFPLNGDVGVLKWRYQTQEETMLPFSLNCWVSDNGSGGCDVNIEYELLQEYLQLNNVQVTIPVGATPVVADCEGDYHHDARRGTLTWTIPLLDRENRSGVMEFSCDGHSDQFYPVLVDFVSPTLYSKIKIVDVVFVENMEPVKYSQDTTLHVDKYEIV